MAQAVVVVIRRFSRRKVLRMGARGLRGLMPIYIVVFVGFLGYSLMIATFTPMILQNDSGMLAATSSLTQRSLLLGLLLAFIRSASSGARPSSARCRIGSAAGRCLSGRWRRRRPSTPGSPARWLPATWFC